MPTTANYPKCFAEIQGRRILDWSLEAFAANGINEICFIGGYRIDSVRKTTQTSFFDTMLTGRITTFSLP